jgi:HEAT repeat protein
MDRPDFVRLIIVALFASCLAGCGHFSDDFWARNENGDWWDFSYKWDLAWNQGGPPLKVLAESQDGDLRCRAIMRLTEPNNPQDLEHYLTILAAAAKSERDVICRIAAVQQLTTYRDPKATQAIIEAYQAPAKGMDTGVMLQLAIVAALGQRKDPAGMDTLVDALNPKNPADLRAAAAQALGRFPNYKSAEALLASLKQDRNIAVRHEAHESLVKLTGRDLPPDAAAWELAFKQAADKGEPLAKEPTLMMKLANWWVD